MGVLVGIYVTPDTLLHVCMHVAVGPVSSTKI